MARRAMAREEPAPSPLTPTTTKSSISAVMTELICNTDRTPNMLPATCAAWPEPSEDVRMDANASMTLTSIGAPIAAAI